MDFTTLTIEALGKLAHITGSYGMAIIVFTILMRICLWPFNVSQQRSMKNMQNLTPKLKMIQEKYKNNPQLMQQKMMEFYKEHNFNPMGGCLPMLIQLPIFMILYVALMSPQFAQIAGDSNFLFIKRLDTTMKSNSAVSFDNKFSLASENNNNFVASSENDRPGSNKVLAKVYISENPEFQEIKIQKPQKAIEIQGDVKIGEPIELKMSLDNLNMKFEELTKVSKVDVIATNLNTRESEKVEFKRMGDILIASIPTEKAQQSIPYDVIILIALFCLTMVLSQKITMAAMQSKNQDPQQAAMNKTIGTVMPLIICGTFIFIPIPAGILLYLVTSNLFQIFQTVTINKQLEIEEQNKKQTKNTEIIDAKVIETKTINNDKNNKTNKQ